MPIKVGQGFERTSSAPIDLSLTLTKAQMLAVQDSAMPDKYFTICQDDGGIYLYDKDATPNAETGKFSKLEGGAGNTYSFALTQAQYDALPDTDKDSENVYYVTDGGGGTAAPPMTQDILWDWEGNHGSGRPGAIGDTITFENPITDYDLILFEIGNNPPTAPSEWKTSGLYTVEEIAEAFGKDVRFYVGMSGYNWSLKFVDATTATISNYDGSNHTWRKVTGIKFGNVMATDASIGRWEKIEEWDLSTFTTKEVTLDLTPYNAVAFSSGHTATQLWNSVVKIVSDWEVGETINSYSADSGGNFNVYLTKNSETSYTIGKAYARQRAVLYGYRETAISPADAKRIADEVKVRPTLQEVVDVGNTAVYEGTQNSTYTKQIAPTKFYVEESANTYDADGSLHSTESRFYQEVYSDSTKTTRKEKRTGAYSAGFIYLNNDRTTGDDTQLSIDTRQNPPTVTMTDDLKAAFQNALGLPIFITDIVVESITGKVTVTTDRAPTTYSITNLVDGAAIAGTWASNVFTPTTPADVLDGNWVVGVS